MFCKIADLITEVPEAGDLVPRCKEYLTNETVGADITIRTDQFRPDSWKDLSENDRIYMESGSHFYLQLLRFEGLMLHSSAVELYGKAYLFSGHSGAGKSTHTQLWQQTFGDQVKVFNDDKPALRRLEDGWYAYGTPWCGKDGINLNSKVALAGICFLKQASQNKIRRLDMQEAAQNLIRQTLRRFKLVDNLDLMLSHVDRLVREIPVFELENRPEPEAARLSYETMRHAAQEAGL